MNCSLLWLKSAVKGLLILRVQDKTLSRDDLMITVSSQIVFLILVFSTVLNKYIIMQQYTLFGIETEPSRKPKSKSQDVQSQ